MIPPRFLARLLALPGLLAPLAGPALAEDAPRVLDQAGAGGLEAPPRRMLNAWLEERVHQALDQRLERLEPLFAEGDVPAWQEETRQRFITALGGFPDDRGPLQASVTGVIERDGYRIEKILYHSQERFPVTASLYLPAGEGPHPAVLHSCGHSDEGKAAEAYQKASALLAIHGIAALCVDPLGQGERKQLASLGVAGATSEHLLMGVAPVLLGENLATTMIWDGIRGLDYLASRPDIDAGRLGCMGNSGGGMMTSYLMALDPRVAAAAPACFITDTRRKNVSPGPGDAEQNIHGQTAFGLDHADFLLMRAPRPALILAATRDFVPVAGAWESFRQAKRLYGRLGFPEGVELAETNDVHGFSPALRVAAARWMARWLRGIDAPLEEPPLEFLPAEALHAAPGGNVLHLEGARSYFDLMAEKEAALSAARARRWAEAETNPRTRAALLAEVRAAIGLPPREELKAAEAFPAGAADRGGIRWEQRIYRPGPGIVLPALLARPQGTLRGAVLHVDGKGKEALLAEPETVSGWLSQGLLVCAVDLRGYGETASEPWRYRSLSESMGPNAAEAYIACMLGLSLVGLRAGDLIQAALALREELPGGAPLHLVARGHAAVPALHAAALERGLFGRIDLSGDLESWSQLCRAPAFDGWQLENAVHGALRLYDLPDLRRTAAGR